MNFFTRPPSCYRLSKTSENTDGDDFSVQNSLGFAINKHLSTSKVCKVMRWSQQPLKNVKDIAADIEVISGLATLTRSVVIVGDKSNSNGIGLYFTGGNK